MNLCITIRWISDEFHLMKRRIKLKLILKVYQITLDALLE